MVGKEQTALSCASTCARIYGVHLSITAPREAREVANEPFAHFAPELARSQSQSPSTRKEPVV
jgi:hypothetical protein